MVLSLTGCVFLAGVTAYAANVTVQENPVVEVGTVLSGSPPASDSYTLEVYRGGLGEERGVYEYPLPALPAGSTITAADFNTYIGEFQSSNSPPTYPNVSFNGYAGDGVYTASDASVALNPIGQTGIVNVGGAMSCLLTNSYVQGLESSSTHLGLMLYAQTQGFSTGFVKSGNYAGVPNLGLNISVPSTGTLQAKPLFDQLATAGTGGTFTLTDGGTDINTQYYPSVVDRRGILRYDLGAIPLGAAITSASITFDVDTITDSPGSYPQPRIYGFAASSTANPTDAQQITDLLGTSSPVTSLGSTTVNLDPLALQSLLASDEYLGITVLGSANSQQFGFTTLESSFANAATLNISYSTPVPEPAAIAFVGAALLFLKKRPRLR